MKEIKLTQGKIALVDDEDYEYLNQWKWCADKIKYTYYAIKHVKGYPSIIRMHRLIMKTPKGMEVDHIDQNGLNNQKSNLRNCTRFQNQLNSRLQKNNITGYRGVYIQRNKYIYAQIVVNKNSVYLGIFSDLISAAKAYDEAAKKYHGEFASLNFKT